MRSTTFATTIALVLAACVAPATDDPPAADGSSSTSESATTLPLPPAPTSTTEPEPTSTSTSTSTGPEPTAGSSTGLDGLGEGEPCNVRETPSECASGLKCMPYDSDGDGWSNASACFPIVADPAGLGEPCQWSGGAWSGYDDCGAYQACWTFEQHFEPIEIGTCIGLCLFDSPGDWETVHCEDPAASPNVGCQECPCVCQTPCDPLLQACDEGLECIPSDYDFFECWPDASGDTGAYGDPCITYIVNMCDPGLVCMDAPAIPGCDADPSRWDGCCTTFCDLTEPNTCPGAAEGQECVPWYEPDWAPVGTEHVGVCVIPQ